MSIDYDGGLHCDLRVSDVVRAIDWYRDVLGFGVIHHVPEAGWAELQSPVTNVRVGLTAVEELPPPGDVDATRAQLEARDDVRFDGETCTIPGWVRLATIYDLDGNTLMLYQDMESPSTP